MCVDLLARTLAGAWHAMAWHDVCVKACAWLFCGMLAETCLLSEVRTFIVRVEFRGSEALEVAALASAHVAGCVMSQRG